MYVRLKHFKKHRQMYRMRINERTRCPNNHVAYILMRRRREEAWLWALLTGLVDANMHKRSCLVVVLLERVLCSGYMLKVCRNV